MTTTNTQNIAVATAMKLTVDALARSKGINKGEQIADISRGNSVTMSPYDLWIEEGFNVRDIDPAHVEMLAQVIVNPDTRFSLPPVEVKVVDVTDLDTGKTVTKLKVIDGHHRTLAYLLARDQYKVEVDKVTVIPFKGDEKAELVKMVVSTQNRKLTVMERARAYFRMSLKGMKNTEIAQLCHDSNNNVGDLIKLCEAPVVLQEMLDGQEIAFSTVTRLMREHSTFNEVIAASQVLIEDKAERKQAKELAKQSGEKPSKTLNTSALKFTTLSKKETEKSQDVITEVRNLLSETKVKEGENVTVTLTPEMVAAILQIGSRIDEVVEHNANVSLEQAKMAQKIKAAKEEAEATAATTEATTTEIQSELDLQVA